MKKAKKQWALELVTLLCVKGRNRAEPAEITSDVKIP